ncbi:hypothetical protein IWQ55_004785 [Labrenzia sp. EL_208]|nr:hypothetical protein [Labrenzia sp. EL_132]MBG6231556.1 hypothetical protein [Labrenzia sp. EL_208]
MPTLSEKHNPDYEIYVCRQCGQSLQKIFMENLDCRPDLRGSDVVNIEYLKRKRDPQGSTS